MFGWLSPGVAGVAVSHSTGQTGPFTGVGFQEQKGHALPRSLLDFTFVDILLAGVGPICVIYPGN